MKPRKPLEPPRGPILAALLALLTGVFFGEAALADDFDDEVDITFSSLEVDDYFGQLEIDYRLDRRDWRWADRRDFDLWVGLYAPDGGDYRFLHGMPLKSNRGKLRFPHHVRYEAYPYVEMCVIAVGVGRGVEPGFGYLCESPVRVDIGYSERPSWRKTGLVFTLGFSSGLYRYRWFHPSYGFSYPRRFYRPPGVTIHFHRFHHHHHHDRARDAERDDTRRGDDRPHPDAGEEKSREDRRRPRPGAERSKPPTTRERQPPPRVRPTPRQRPDRSKRAPERPKTENRSSPRLERPKERSVQPRRPDVRPKERQIQPRRPTIRGQEKRAAPKRQSPAPEQQRKRPSPKRPDRGGQPPKKKK